MGTALGRALRRAGHRIELVITQHPTSARRAGDLIGGQPVQLTTRQLARQTPDVLERLAKCDVLLISTPDDALESTAERLAALLSAPAMTSQRRSRVALHTSGATSSRVLSALATRGYIIGSLHPLVSIADPAKARDPFRGTYFCVEGDRAAVRVASRLVSDLAGCTFTIHSESKPLYHAAAAISSGHVVALVDLAIEMLEECGLSRQRAQEILAPLLSSNIQNLISRNPSKALTGPFARGDVATIQKHLVAIKSRKIEGAAELYAALGRRAIRLARTTQRDRRSLTAIAKLLAM